MNIHGGIFGLTRVEATSYGECHWLALNDGELAIHMAPHRAHAMAAAFNGAAVVDTANIPALRQFIQDNAARAGLCVYDRQEAAE